MVIKYFSFLVLMLITVSWASSNDDGEEVTVPFSQVGEALIEEALNTSEISSLFTSSSHAILSSIASKNEYTMPFYDFAVQNYDFYELGFDSEDPQYWNAFINTPFRDFSSQQPDRAQEIINNIVLPSHPFLSQVPFTFQTAKLLGQLNPFIEVFLDKVAKDIFAQQFSQILALEDQSEAQILLKDLLHKSKNSSFPDPAFKYHHAFIANVPFDYFKRTDYCRPEHHANINSFISLLASNLYYEIAKDSKQLADEMLSGLLPSIYSKLTYTSYQKTIEKYQESSLQPIDKSYLWDPQEFHGDVLEALQALSVVENSNFLPYLEILEFLSDDSPLANLFRHYIAQNFCKPSDLRIQHQHQSPLFSLFWRSLIFSSFTDFSAIFPHHSHQILQQLQLLPSLDEVQSLFVNGLLDDQFSSEFDFPLITLWDHTSTIELLLLRFTDIPAYVIDDALEYASFTGHTTTVDLLLQRRTDIAVDLVSLALHNASINGHTSTVDLLLQRRTDISANNAGSALQEAAKSGNTLTVQIILQCRTDISTDYVSRALEYASGHGYTPIAELLLQRRTDIFADYVGRSLEYASGGGYTPIVELLLQFRTDILFDKVGHALEYASGHGYTPIVELLLQSRTDIPSDNVCRALRSASESGHIAIIELFLQCNTDISTDYVSGALEKASQGGHTPIVELLLQRCADISAYHAGSALRSAAESGHTAIVELLLRSYTEISADHVGDALEEASERGHTTIVELLLQRRNDMLQTTM
jgi:ankyrin repeat protein